MSAPQQPSEVFGQLPIETDVPIATLELGSVTFDDQGAKYNTVSDAGSFPRYMIRNSYEKDHHRYMLGVSSPNPFQGRSAAFVQLAAPTLLWVCEWEATRWRVQPLIPDPDKIADANWVLLDENYTLYMITVGPEGDNPLYRCDGVYVYGHRNPDAQTIRNVCYGRPPWLDDFASRLMPASFLTANLIDSQGALNLLNPLPR